MNLFVESQLKTATSILYSYSLFIEDHKVKTVSNPLLLNFEIKVKLKINNFESGEVYVTVWGEKLLHTLYFLPLMMLCYNKYGKYDK